MCEVDGHDKELHERYGPNGERSTNMWDLMEVFGNQMQLTPTGFKING